MLVGVLALSGCRELNPEFGAATDAMGTGSSSAGTDTGTVGLSSGGSGSGSGSFGGPMREDTERPPPPPGSCGNGQVDGENEECDGDALLQTCEGLGEPGGGLSCGDDCSFDVSGCVCGGVQTALGGACPNACTGGCSADTCTIDCTGAGTCADESVTCPPGWRCRVQCDADSCSGLVLDCANHGCTIACNGDTACSDAAVNCGVGPCLVQCGTGNTPCENLELNCGPNHSSVSCTTPDATVVANEDAGSSCDCEAIDC